MLSYAFQVLRNSNYEDLASEPFDHAQDLLAAILSKGLAQLVKQGLYREYTSKEESLMVMRGKLDVAGTIRNRIQRKQDLACEFDELSENNLYNRILKTTLHYLVRDEGVDPDRKGHSRRSLSTLTGLTYWTPQKSPGQSSTICEIMRPTNFS